jgi:hypothetical protein
VPGRQFFCRGQPRAYHVHLVEEGGPLWREYLRAETMLLGSGRLKVIRRGARQRPFIIQVARFLSVMWLAYARAQGSDISTHIEWVCNAFASGSLLVTHAWSCRRRNEQKDLRMVTSSRSRSSSLLVGSRLAG